MLHVVHAGQGLHASPQSRVGGHILDPLTVKVDLRPVLLHVGDVFRPGSLAGMADSCCLLPGSFRNGITLSEGSHGLNL